MSRLLPILLLALACRAADVEMVVSQFRGLSARPGCAWPVRVELTVKASSFTGALEATTDKGMSVVVRQPVEVGTGTFVYWLYPVVYQPASAVTVQVKTTAGETVATGSLPVGWPIAFDFEQTLAVVNANHLGKLPGEVLRTTDQRLLPDRWDGYELLSVILWDAETPGKLSAEQQEALYTWLAMGGRLLIATRLDDLTVHSPMPRRLPDWPNAAAIPAFQRIGDGVVYHCLLTPDSIGQYINTFADPDWHRIDIVPLDAHVRVAGEPLLRRAELDQAVAGYRPDLMPLIRFGLFYLLLMAGIDLLVVRRLRRGLTWITYPLAIAGFTAYAWHHFRQDNPWESGAQVTYVDRLPHTDLTVRTDFSRWVDPRRQWYSLELPAEQRVRPLAGTPEDDEDGTYFGSPDEAWAPVMSIETGQAAQRVQVRTDPLANTDLRGLDVTRIEHGVPSLLKPDWKWDGERLMGSVKGPAPGGKGLVFFRKQGYGFTDGQLRASDINPVTVVLAGGLIPLDSRANDRPLLLSLVYREDQSRLIESLLHEGLTHEGIVSLAPDEAYVIWVGNLPRDLPAGPGLHVMVIRERFDLSDLVAP